MSLWDLPRQGESGKIVVGLVLKSGLMRRGILYMSDKWKRGGLHLVGEYVVENGVFGCFSGQNALKSLLLVKGALRTVYERRVSD